jgi:hypothetical protein
LIAQPLLALFSAGPVSADQIRSGAWILLAAAIADCAVGRFAKSRA